MISRETVRSIPAWWQVLDVLRRWVARDKFHDTRCKADAPVQGRVFQHFGGVGQWVRVDVFYRSDLSVKIGLRHLRLF